MNIKTVKLNYTAIQAAFWMEYCVVIAFATVYLQSLGYSNSALGTILALGHTFGFLFATVFATLTDRYEKINSVIVEYIAIFLQGVSVILLVLFPAMGLLNAGVYVLNIAFLACGVSVNTKLCLELQDAGYGISFGVARGFGSLGYTVISFVIGGLVERYSCKVLILCTVLLLILRLILNWLAGRALQHSEKAGANTPAASDVIPHTTENVFSLLAGHKRFFIFLIGVVLFFTDHEGASSFMINIVRNIGGNTDDMGKIAAFRALIETPMMFLYPHIRKKYNVSTLLKFSFAAYVLKSFAIFAAGSIPMLCLALVLQPFSFGIFLPALVDYVGIIIPAEDSAKGQALGSGAMTVGSILCNFLLGWLYDLFPVKTVLLISAGLCTAGSAIAWFTTQKDRPAERI